MSKIASGLMDFKPQFYFVLVSRCLFVVVPLAYLLNHEITIQNVALILLMSYLLNALLLFFYLKRKIFRSDAGINFNLLSSALKICIPLGIIVIINLLYDRIDILLISNILNFSDTGRYNVAYGLLKASTLSFSFILTEGFSKVSYLSEKISSVKSFLRKYFTIIFLISALTALILYFLPDVLVVFFYSAKYESSAGLLKLLSFAIIPLALNNLTGITLNGMGKFNAVLIATLIGLCLNIVLNIIFIPRLGLNAACYATFATEITVLLLESIFLYKILREK